MGSDLTPKEQARVIELLVERVDFDGSAGKVAITFRPAGIRTLADELVQPMGATR
jgi:site-specific DNA recombinase